MKSDGHHVDPGLKIDAYTNPQGTPQKRPARSLMNMPTQELHDGIDQCMRNRGLAYLNPDGPSIQTDLFGGAEMQAWQLEKAQRAMLGTGVWSAMPQIYSRYGTESGRALISKILILEKAAGVMLTDSGMQAVATVVDALVQPGQHVLVAEQIYNKSRTYIEWTSSRMGTHVEVLPRITPEIVQQKVRDTTRLILVETFSNPLLQALSPKAIGEAVWGLQTSRAPDLRLVIDHTIVTPWGLKAPLLTLPGVDAVLLSGTKALSGHDQHMWGYIASKRPGLVNACMDIQAMRGGGLSWQVAEAVSVGLDEAKTLFKRRCTSASMVADFLSAHPQVEEVWHPSLVNHADHDVVRAEYTAFGALLSFRIKATSEEAVAHFCDVLATTGVIRYALSFDGLSSKINHHKTVSEFHTPDPVLRKRGQHKLARLGVGVEAPEDIIACLNWALWQHGNLSAEDVALWQVERKRDLGLMASTL